jgi:hypothetical protein
VSFSDGIFPAIILQKMQLGSEFIDSLDFIVSTPGMIVIERQFCRDQKHF